MSLRAFQVFYAVIRWNCVNLKAIIKKISKLVTYFMRRQAVLYEIISENFLRYFES